jgi:hypothetical protein
MTRSGSGSKLGEGPGGPSWGRRGRGHLSLEGELESQLYLPFDQNQYEESSLILVARSSRGRRAGSGAREDREALDQAQRFRRSEHG